MHGQGKHIIRMNVFVEQAVQTNITNSTKKILNKHYISVSEHCMQHPLLYCKYYYFTVNQANAFYFKCKLIEFLARTIWTTYGVVHINAGVRI